MGRTLVFPVFDNVLRCFDELPLSRRLEIAD